MTVTIRRSAGALLSALFALLPLPAGAVTGGREAAEDGTALMVLSSKGAVCSAVVVARDAVVTAGHCAAGGAEYRVHWREGGEPVLAEVAERALHPGYDAGAVAGRRRSIDLALLRTARPLPARFRPATLSGAMPAAGETLTLSGFGETAGGGARSTGTLREVALPVVEPYGPSRILVWLKGGAGGACQGDSGGPIAGPDGAVRALAAWVGGACGGLTQGVLVGPQRGWIDQVLGGWGRSARWTT